jgi:hypothetical protein
MGDAHHGHAIAREQDHGLEHFLHHLGVQCGSGFVEQHDRRIQAQSPRNGHTLLLPAGQLGRVSLRLVCQSHLVQLLHRDGLRFRPRSLAHPILREHAVLENGEVWEEIELLKHHADVRPHEIVVSDLRRDSDAVDLDLAALVGLQSIDAPRQR